MLLGQELKFKNKLCNLKLGTFFSALPLYRHFYKCLYIKLLKILLIYRLLDKFSVFDNLKIIFIALIYRKLWHIANPIYVYH